LGSVSEDVVPPLREILGGKLGNGGTTLEIDSWKRYALWYWSWVLFEAKKEGDTKRHSYAKHILRFLLRGCSK